MQQIKQYYFKFLPSSNHKTIPRASNNFLLNSIINIPIFPLNLNLNLNLMPFTATIFSSFIGKKKNKEPRPRNTLDEVSLVKAAAWAWYQRGSGSEGKLVGEFCIRRMQAVIYRPSRYKLEAMKIVEKEEADDNSKACTSPAHCNNNGNSLFDNYEIESISNRLDQLIDSNTASKLFDDDGQKTVSCNSSSNCKKKSKKSGGGWFRQAVICGTGEDVVVSRRLSENGSTVVKSSSTSLPRVTHA